MSPDTEPRPRRTRLGADRERDLHRAVLDLLREAGYDALTMDAIAARARTSKATLYRQWNGKAELVAAALHSTRRPADGIDTGSLRGDLHELVRRRCDGSLQDAGLLRALGQALHKDPELMRAFRSQIVEPGNGALTAMLRRGADRGEIDPDRPAARFVPHMVLGAAVGRFLIEGAEADPAYLEAYVDAVVLPALGLRP